MTRFALLLPFLMVACAPAVDDVQPVEIDAEQPEVSSGLEERLPDTCKLDNFRSFVGQQFADVTVPEGTKTRVVLPGMILSQVYEADRVNIHVNADGQITKVICG